MCCFKTQNKGKESENSYKKLKRSPRDRHTKTHGNSIEDISTGTAVFVNRKRVNIFDTVLSFPRGLIYKGVNLKYWINYLQGETDIEQLAIVIKKLGTPDQETWPGVTELPDYSKISFPETKGMSWDQIFPDCSAEAIDLTKRFLIYNADKRLKAKQVM